MLPAGSSETQSPSAWEQEWGSAARATVCAAAAAAVLAGAAPDAGPGAEAGSGLAPDLAQQPGLACLEASPAVSPALSPLLTPAWQGLAAGVQDFSIPIPDLCAWGVQHWASPQSGSPEGGCLAAPQGQPSGSHWLVQGTAQQPWQGTGGPWQGFEGPWQGLEAPWQRLDVLSPETPEGKTPAALGAGSASDAAGGRTGSEPATIYGSPHLPELGAHTPYQMISDAA